MGHSGPGSDATVGAPCSSTTLREDEEEEDEEEEVAETVLSGVPLDCKCTAEEARGERPPPVSHP